MQYEQLPGSRRWADGIGDAKCDVLIRYRIYRMMEALQMQELDNSNKSKGKR